MKDKNTEYMPDQLWHQKLSFIKSGVRVGGFIWLMLDVTVGAVLLIIAEVIGVVEELV